VSVAGSAYSVEISTVVMLNLFQHPCAVTCTTGVVFLATGRAWMLKQVQHDEV
jgi:hypothetical protein